MNIEYLDSIDSTNSELMRRAVSGDYSTVCLVAKTQTAGRGRLGRAWLSDGQSLMLSVGIPLAPQDWSGLSLAVGVSIAESLHPRIQIKWPNDLWVAGKKLAGILIETCAMPREAARYVVVGVGINIDAPSASIAQDMKTLPCGLRELMPAITAQETLDKVLAPLLHAMHNFEQHGWKPYGARFAARDALQGKEIELSSGMVGAYLGLNAQGALQLQTLNGRESIVSHEVSVCR
jgi:BirA family transcriptional regulator, biotin operon repressor / biotin---[acetyl-CoA-carboxylase] ligase